MTEYTSPITIRIATPADAGTLAELARRTFDETFADQNRPEDMEMYLNATFGERQQTRELNDRSITTFLAEQDGVAVGYAQVRSGRAPATVGEGRALEIARFYVDRNAHGRGVAQQLMHAVQAHARANDCTLLWLGVWESNARAIAFYRKFGFERCGSQPFILGTDLQTDDLMRAQLKADGTRHAGG
jgi:ribosomal protein S18 acetylase RimI-like enzyme